MTKPFAKLEKVISINDMDAEILLVMWSNPIHTQVTTMDGYVTIIPTDFLEKAEIPSAV